MTQPLNQVRIQLGSLNNPIDIQRLVTHLQTLYSGQINVITGSGAPTMAPPKISSQYIDTVNKQVYVAAGNSKATDWVRVS